MLLDLPLAIWILCRFVVANLVVVWLGLLRLAEMFTYGPKLVVQDSIGTIIDFKRNFGVSIKGFIVATLLELGFAKSTQH